MSPFRSVLILPHFVVLLTVSFFTIVFHSHHFFIILINYFCHFCIILTLFHPVLHHSKKKLLFVLFIYHSCLPFLYFFHNFIVLFIAIVQQRYSHPISVTPHTLSLAIHFFYCAPFKPFFTIFPQQGVSFFVCELLLHIIIFLPS